MAEIPTAAAVLIIAPKFPTSSILSKTKTKTFFF
jgi:hypothetical protein